MKIEGIRCDFCDEIEEPESWTGVEVVDRGADPEVLHFCNYECLKLWAEEQQERQEEMGQAAGSFSERLQQDMAKIERWARQVMTDVPLSERFQEALKILLGGDSDD